MLLSIQLNQLHLDNKYLTYEHITEILYMTSETYDLLMIYDDAYVFF
jgi:hypothetical protein